MERALDKTTGNKSLVKPMDAFKQVMAAPSVREQFQNALADNSKMFTASLIEVFNGDQSLQKCKPAAIISEALKAATLQLPISKSLGMAYILAFNNRRKVGNGWVTQTEPVFVLGYKGLIQLAMRTGQYRILNVGCVFEGEYVGEEKLTGKIDLSGSRESDTVVGYFAHLEMINGFTKTVFISYEDAQDHGRKYSKSYDNNSSPWKKNPHEMGEKTVLRKLLSRFGMLSIEMASAIAATENEDKIEYADNDTNDAGYPELLDVDMVTGEVKETKVPEGQESLAADALLAETANMSKNELPQRLF